MTMVTGVIWTRYTVSVTVRYCACRFDMRGPQNRTEPNAVLPRAGAAARTASAP